MGFATLLAQLVLWIETLGTCGKTMLKVKLLKVKPLKARQPCKPSEMIALRACALSTVVCLTRSEAQNSIPDYSLCLYLQIEAPFCRIAKESVDLAEIGRR